MKLTYLYYVSKYMVIDLYYLSYKCNQRRNYFK